MKLAIWMNGGCGSSRGDNLPFLWFAIGVIRVIRGLSDIGLYFEKNPISPEKGSLCL